VTLALVSREEKQPQNLVEKSNKESKQERKKNRKPKKERKNAAFIVTIEYGTLYRLI